MAENVKLKDLYADEKVYDGINTVKIPKADGTGNAKFIIPPSQKFMLRESDYQEDYVHGSGTTIAISEEDESGNFMFAFIANTEMHISEPKIIGVSTFAKYNSFAAYHSMTEQTITEFMTRIFQSEAEESVIVTPDTYVVKKGWTNIGYTVTTEGKIVRVAIEKFEQITDPSAFIFDACLPWHINEGKENYFYAYIAEATQQVKSVSVTENGTKIINPDSGKSGLSAVQLSVDVPTITANLQDKSVAITENGTQEFSADTGYDGIKKLTATVNVAGGGGTSVQPDYAQNNSAAADYIKNRPGGYMIEYPSITKTYTGTTDDPNYISGGGEAPNLFRFSDTPLPSEAILKGVGKFTKSDGTITEIETISVGEEMSGFGTIFSVTSGDANAEIYLLQQEMDGLSGVIFASLPGGAYISEFTSAAVSEPAVIDEKYIAVKPSNWGVPEKDLGDGYISSRIGGFWGSNNNPWRFDGDLTGKEVITVDSDYKFIKISDDAVPLDYVARGGVSQEDFGSSTGYGISISRSDIKLFTDLVGRPITDGDGFIVKKTGQFTGAPTDKELDLVISVQTPYAMQGEVKITQGTWFLYKEGSGDTPAHYISGVYWSNGGRNDDHIVRMPYEFVEQHPNTLTTDAQTLTDAQKLQARTNIGTVAGTDKEMILRSSTAGSTKKFKITVTDDGTLTATEIAQ